MSSNPTTPRIPSDLTTTPTPPDSNRPSRRALFLTFTALTTAILLVTLGPAILTPLAGPWAARLLGHSCGMSDQLPLPSLLLALAAAPTLYLAFNRRLSRLRLIPALLWIPLWTLAGFASFINTLE